MTNEFAWKMRQKELVHSLLNICKKNSIDVFLCGETALTAFRDGAFPDNITLAVDASEAMDLIEAIEAAGNENLDYECMINNGIYPKFDIRIFDKTTVDFNINNCRKYRNNCINVCIKFVEHINLFGIPFAIGRLAFRKNLRKGSMDSCGSSARLFKMMAFIGKGKSSKLKIGGIDQHGDSIKEKKLINVDGVDCYIPANHEVYFEAEFGKNWEKHECNRFVEDEVHFRTVNYSWEIYKEAISGVDLDGYFLEKEKYQKENNEFLKVQKTVQQYYDFMDRTYDRICLWEKYRAKKDELRKYRDNGQIERLKECLGQYIEKIEIYADMNLGLCFDPEIFEMACEVLISDGKESLAKKAYDLIPEKHRSPLILKDYKGNII